MTDFDFLVTQVKRNYPGFQDKTAGNNAIELTKLEHDLVRRIGLHPDSCGYFMKKYVSFFRDEHLRIREVEGHAREMAHDSPPGFMRKIVVDTGELFRRTVSSATIEGLWLSWWGEIAVVRDAGTGDFHGVSVNYIGYDPGTVLFDFITGGNGGSGPGKEPLAGDTAFTFTSYSGRDGSPAGKGRASLHVNRHILEVHGTGFFVRKSASPRDDQALMTSYLPLYPNSTNQYFTYSCLGDSTFFIRIPGFDGYRDTLEKTIRRHWHEIMSRPNLVIDIRNNGGGLDDEWDILQKLMYTGPFITPGVEWYASEDIMAGYEEDLSTGNISGGEEGEKWCRVLLAEMKKHPGGFVIHPMMGSCDTTSEDTVYTNPQRIGIIINQRNGSAAEAFLLAAKQSRKVTLFGDQHTAGILDYSNTVSVDFPSKKYALKYPTSRSLRLPAHPIDNTGINPDVVIPYPPTLQLFDKIDPWVEYVRAWLEEGATR
jgi:hypothetical protein